MGEAHRSWARDMRLKNKWNMSHQHWHSHSHSHSTVHGTVQYSHSLESNWIFALAEHHPGNVS